MCLPPNSCFPTTAIYPFQVFQLEHCACCYTIFCQPPTHSSMHWFTNTVNHISPLPACSIWSCQQEALGNKALVPCHLLPVIRVDLETALPFGNGCSLLVAVDSSFQVVHIPKPASLHSSMTTALSSKLPLPLFFFFFPGTGH